MWKTLRALLGDLRQAPITDLGLEVAGLALLLEIARADHNSTSDERKAIARAATQVFGVEGATADALIAEAEIAVDEAVSLFDFTRLLNDRLDRTMKLRLLEHLWRVAYVDGHLDHFEEYFLRKICDLLHLSHRDLIRAKLAVVADG
ncbi:MAG: TerB family tellurite resistance protein [Gammaproteobacteria bacterium]